MDCEIIKLFILEFVSQEEIDNIIVVMGGNDWELWIDVLSNVGVLSEFCKIMAYIYVGEQVICDIYWDGIIGVVKKDLDCVVGGMCDKGIDFRVLVLKVVVI